MENAQLEVLELLIHEGVETGRLDHPSSDIERALAELWKGWNSHENISGPALYFLLNPHALGSPPSGFGLFHPVGTQLGEPSQRDATVAATIIQWLGTNIGRLFLVEAFSRAEYELVWKKKTAS